MPQLKRHDDLLLYIAMGDAYALAAEFVRQEKHESLFDDLLGFRGYQTNPRYPELVSGMYSDDTEMSCALARALIRGSDPGTQRLVHFFYDEFVYGGCRLGYSKGFQSVLKDCESGHDLLTALRARGGRSRQNGAAMRSIPIGVLPTAEQAMRVAERQAKITHHTPDGVWSSVFIALLAHYGLYGYDLDYAVDLAAIELHKRYPYLTDRFSYVFYQPFLPHTERVVNDETGAIAIPTIRAVLWHLLNEDDLLTQMKSLLLRGGDTDSVAALVWGLSSIWNRDGILPEFLERDLESGSHKTGSVRLRSLGKQLMDTYI